MNALKTKQEAMIEALAAIEGNAVISFVAVTEKKALKKSRVTGEATPAEYTGIKKYTYRESTVGADYQTEVNIERQAEGSSGDFESKESYHQYHTENGVVREHKKAGTLYLGIFGNLQTHSGVSFYYDGSDAEMSKEDFYKIEAEYLSGWQDPSKRKATAQANQGVEDPIKFVLYKLSGIKYLAVGDKVIINELDADLMNRIKTEEG